MRSGGNEALLVTYEQIWAGILVKTQGVRQLFAGWLRSSLERLVACHRKYSTFLDSPRVI